MVVHAAVAPLAIFKAAVTIANATAVFLAPIIVATVCYCSKATFIYARIAVKQENNAEKGTVSGCARASVAALKPKIRETCASQPSAAEEKARAEARESPKAGAFRRRRLGANYAKDKSPQRAAKKATSFPTRALRATRATGAGVARSKAACEADTYAETAPSPSAEPAFAPKTTDRAKRAATRERYPFATRPTTATSAICAARQPRQTLAPTTTTPRRASKRSTAIG